MAEQGIKKPREEEFSSEVLDEIAEARQRARAAIAELEILHRDRLAKLADPAAINEEEEDYRRERQRIEDKRDRAIDKLRQSAEGTITSPPGTR